MCWGEEAREKGIRKRVENSLPCSHPGARGMQGTQETHSDSSVPRQGVPGARPSWGHGDGCAAALPLTFTSLPAPAEVT